MTQPKILSALPRKRGRVGADLGCFALFPSRTAHAGFFYAIGFVGGVVKIGRAHDVRGRLRDHAKRAEGEVLWAHVFGPGCRSYLLNAERAALDALQKVCQRINRSEWFHCDDRDLVLRTVRPVLAEAKRRAEIWEAEREAAARRSALASRLLAEHEAKFPAPAPAAEAQA